jgi:hypothetical protein
MSLFAALLYTCAKTGGHVNPGNNLNKKNAFLIENI